MFWLTNKFPLLDASGAPYAVCAISAGITSQKKLEEELKAADQRKDEFLAMLAHELRNPLAPADAVEVLRMIVPRKRGSKAREVIDRQITHLTRLVDDCSMSPASPRRRWPSISRPSTFPSSSPAPVDQPGI